MCSRQLLAVRFNRGPSVSVRKTPLPVCIGVMLVLVNKRINLGVSSPRCYGGHDITRSPDDKVTVQEQRDKVLTRAPEGIIMSMPRLHSVSFAG